MNNKQCEWCDHQFVPAVRYQVYCSAECREDATKENIRAKNVLLKLKKRYGQKRVCLSCSSPLSIYNDDDICTSCEVNPKDVSKALKDIKRMSNGKD